MSERFKLIAKGLPVQPLLDKLAEHPDLWGLITARQAYPGSAHKETESIYLRWATDESLAGGFFCLESRDHEETINKLAPEIWDLMNAALSAILGDMRELTEKPDIGRVLLTRMKPGGRITEHVDEGPYADKYDRFHVCLSGYSQFSCGGQMRVMEPGTLWWFNHKVEHSVVNADLDRIHLIIDLVAPEYRAKRGLTFQRERTHELLDEARPLFEAHYKEIAHYQDIPLDINEDAYRLAEEMGQVRAFTARYNGTLVGYCVFKVGPNLRYSSSIQALQDILFVDKTRRGALIGKRLLEFGRERLRAEGVQVEYQHSKAGDKIKKAIAELKDRDDVGRLFEMEGYELIDLVYGKRLDR